MDKKKILKFPLKNRFFDSFEISPENINVMEYVKIFWIDFTNFAILKINFGK